MTPFESLCRSADSDVHTLLCAGRYLPMIKPYADARIVDLQGLNQEGRSAFIREHQICCHLLFTRHCQVDQRTIEYGFRPAASLFYCVQLGQQCSRYVDFVRLSDAVARIGG